MQFQLWNFIFSFFFFEYISHFGDAQYTKTNINLIQFFYH